MKRREFLKLTFGLAAISVLSKLLPETSGLNNIQSVEDYAGPVTFQSLNELFKDIYGPHMEQLIPQQSSIFNIDRDKYNAWKGGNAYHQPVILGSEHGVTFK